MIADDMALSRTMAAAVGRHPELQLLTQAEHRDIQVRADRFAIECR
jgi:hypothetical protein